MRTSFTSVCKRLRQARSAEDVFGALADRAALKRRYHELASIIHPDHNPGQVDAASEAFTILQQWYTLACDHIAYVGSGAARISVVTDMGRYVAYEAPLQGDLCDLFVCDTAGKEVLLKVVRNPRNNDLLEAEARVLQQFDRDLRGQPVRAHFPTLVEAFRLRDTAGVQRHTNVLYAGTGYVSLAEVLQAYPDGLHPADAAWMFNRLLAALAITHDRGLVHGAVVPAHILIRPSDHNGMLIDWCYSVAPGEILKAISPPYAACYPPEVHTRQPVTAATDLYMAALCMVCLLGGDPSNGLLPASVPRPIQALLRACLLPAPARRANNAWQVFEDFRAILRQLYGPPHFRPFSLEHETFKRKTQSAERKMESL